MNRDNGELLAKTIEGADHRNPGTWVGWNQEFLTKEDWTGDKKPVLPDSFNLNIFRLTKENEPAHGGCNTVGCIAGYALGLFPECMPRKRYFGSAGNYMETITRALDISIRPQAVPTRL